ncbi:MAG: metal-sensitive transcriptional regulator [Candidatus Dojkabacteria bacterium]
MKSNEQLINNIVGQLNGVKKMVDEEKDPFAVITQMKAARSALNSVMTKYIEQNFWTFIKDCENEEEACRSFFTELIRNS